MTGLPNHDQREALPDSELDALLAAADADLLRYAEAKTDPARLLLTLMAADNGAELESRPSEVRSSDQLLDSVLTAESAAPARLLLLHRAVRAVTIADNAEIHDQPEAETDLTDNSNDKDRGPDHRVNESDYIISLVHQAQDGSSDAFGELYRIYVDTVFRYIYYRVSTRALAEDLTSETFVRALRRITGFRWQGRDFGAWLVTIARHLVADHFRLSRHRMEVSAGEMLDSNEVEPSSEDSVLERLPNEALLDAVHQLNDQQRECVTLRFLQGLSVAETADIMGKSEGAVHTLSHRALHILSRILTPETDDGSSGNLGPRDFLLTGAGCEEEEEEE